VVRLSHSQPEPPSERGTYNTGIANRAGEAPGGAQDKNAEFSALIAAARS
jgi:hypothetical protein